MELENDQNGLASGRTGDQLEQAMDVVEDE
jgi:hypothetical protein